MFFCVSTSVFFGGVREILGETGRSSVLIKMKIEKN